jgi:hypothetical protein
MTKMDPKLKADWVAALRSGDFQQTRGNLESDGGFCCLGVLCKVAGLRITGGNRVAGSESCRPYGPILDLLGLSHAYSLTIRNDGGDLSEENDGSEIVRRHSFAEIADFIEANL